ncbi:MAG: magnesium transporter MgtE N-terminal domain-containing protein, partial [bacterium]
AQRREVEALLVRVEGNTRFLAADRGRLLAQVARVYETMKPEEAAVILTGLDSGTSTDILRRMPERAAARVMAAFDPAAAARFSESMLRP